MLSCIYSACGEAPNDLSKIGSSLRHWPPGTNSKTVRAVFFCAHMQGYTGCVRTRYGGRRGFQPPHNAQKINGAFRPNAVHLSGKGNV
jgi:hypothetical protein